MVTVIFFRWPQGSFALFFKEIFRGFTVRFMAD
jgi:hypothetical protein